MPPTLPEHVDAARLAAQGVSLEGEIPAAALRRLSAAYSEVGAVTVSVGFALNELRQIVVRGEVRGHLSATCQRCLRPVALEVRGEFEHLPEAEEMLEVGTTAGTLDLLALVEDEMFLACPMIPRHDTLECPQAVAGDGDLPRTDGGERKNPFDVLATLRQTSNDNPRGTAVASNSEE